MMRLGRISRFNRSAAVLATVVFLCAGFEYQPSFEKLAGDAQMALDTWGRTTVRNTPHGDRPRIRADSSSDGGSDAMRAATGRYT